MLSSYGEVDIAAHQLARTDHLMSRQSALHCECLVHPHQPFYPGIDQQVVAYTYLYCRGIVVVHQHHVEQSRVKHDVTMVAQEGVAQSEVRGVSSKTRIIKGAAVGILPDDILHHRFHKSFLEVEGRLHSPESKSQQRVAYRLWQPGSKSLEHGRELAIVEQVIKCLLHLFRFIRSYLVKIPNIHR